MREWFYIELDDVHVYGQRIWGQKFLNTAGLNDVNEEEPRKLS